ncbi:hypothetical protein, partial [Serratia marcescens]|uniref:hypothetical protein n=1 Tax=Serratia marcescens TaxID=615 RepID=UPI003FA79FD5
IFQGLLIHFIFMRFVLIRLTGKIGVGHVGLFFVSFRLPVCKRQIVNQAGVMPKMIDGEKSFVGRDKYFLCVITNKVQRKSRRQ